MYSLLFWTPSIYFRFYWNCCIQCLSHSTIYNLNKLHACQKATNDLHINLNAESDVCRWFWEIILEKGIEIVLIGIPAFTYLFLSTLRKTHVQRRKNKLVRIKTVKTIKHKSACTRNFLSKRCWVTVYHCCKYVNILYDCGNILTCHSLAFLWLNPSNCRIVHSYLRMHICMKTFRDNWIGLTWLRFKIWQHNESDLLVLNGPCSTHIVW